MKYPAVIFDGRVLQTNTWHRGMGRYTLGLIKGFSEQDQRVVVVLAEDLPGLGEREAVLKSVNPNVEIYTISLVSGGSDIVEKTNTKNFDSFVQDNHLEDSLFIISSLFTFEYSPFSSKKTINSCIFYDLLPLTHWHILGGYYGEYEYFRRYRFLYLMDKILAISEHVKDEMIEHLGFKSSDITNISGANVSFASEGEDVKLEKRSHKYLLLPGGDAPHKNMMRAVYAFSIFKSRFKTDHKLLITSFYSEGNKQDMKRLSSDIELVGQVSDDELHSLYKNSEGVLFPSLDEGLGLPILEAVSYDKKVMCSDIDVFKEFSEDAFYFFNPLNPEDMADAIQRAVFDDSKTLLNKYDEIKEKFTWKRSSELIVKAKITKRKIENSHRQTHAIVAEQENSYELIKLIGSIVRDNYPAKDIALYVNSLDRKSQKVPFVFNSIFTTKDIADAFSNKHESKTIIYTDKSVYSKALAKPDDEILYLGVKAEDVNQNFNNAWKN